MKEQILKIAKDLEQGTITETEARTLLLGLLGDSKRFKIDPNKVIKTEPKMIRESGFNLFG
jgi:nanoRNase/pAp phosphatase (c-di-AMP/oligoRNAs hydrolase)